MMRLAATPLQIGWVIVLILIYAAFIAWYGGQRTPVTPAQGAAFLDQARANRQPGAEEHPEFRRNLESLIARDDGREFLMVNIETNKTGPEAEAADAAYSRAVLPMLLRRGSFPVYVGKPVGPVLGALGSGVDRVAIVRYRSLSDLLDMTADPAMSTGATHKFAALAHTEVFASRPVISAIQVRLTVGLLMLVIGASGWLALGRFLRS